MSTPRRSASPSRYTMSLTWAPSPRSTSGGVLEGVEVLVLEVEIGCGLVDGVQVRGPEAELSGVGPGVPPIGVDAVGPEQLHGVGPDRQDRLGHEAGADVGPDHR